MEQADFLTGLNPLQLRLTEVCRALAEDESVFINAKDVLAVIATEDWNMDDETFEEECEELNCGVASIEHYDPESVGYAYRVLLKMGLPWRNRYPLLDLKGMIGDFHDEHPFGPESVEVRRSKYANILFPFHKNPVLPVSLLNGVVLSDDTEIPSHNLEELWMGMEHLRQDPQLSLRELMEIMPGPDFGPGGVMGGFDAIYAFYEKGEGPLTLRGQIDTVIDGGRTRVAVRSLPHGVLLNTVLTQIKALHATESCPPFILKSDSEGMKLDIIIDMPPTISADELKAILYRKTDLERTVHFRCAFQDCKGWTVEGPLITVLKEAVAQCSSAWKQKNGQALKHVPFIRDIIRFKGFKNPLNTLTDARRTVILKTHAL